MKGNPRKKKTHYIQKNKDKDFSRLLVRTYISQETVK